MQKSIISKLKTFFSHKKVSLPKKENTTISTVNSLEFHLAKLYLINHFTQQNIDASQIYHINLSVNKHKAITHVNKYDLFHAFKKQIISIIHQISEDKEQSQLLLSIAMQPFKTKSLKKASKEIYTMYHEHIHNFKS